MIKREIWEIDPTHEIPKNKLYKFQKKCVRCKVKFSTKNNVIEYCDLCKNK